MNTWHPISNNLNTIPARSGAGRWALIIYILYLIGIFLALGAITVPIGVIMAYFGAYFSKRDGPDWVRTHYRSQIQTFWISALFIVFCFFAIVAWEESDWQREIFRAWAVGILSYSVIVGVMFFIIRCAKGLVLLIKCKEYTWRVPILF